MGGLRDPSTRRQKGPRSILETGRAAAQTRAVGQGLPVLRPTDAPHRPTPAQGARLKSSRRKIEEALAAGFCRGAAETAKTTSQERDERFHVEIANRGNLKHEFFRQTKFKNDCLIRLSRIPRLFQKRTVSHRRLPGNGLQADHEPNPHRLPAKQSLAGIILTP